jgi:hypothetical protein
MKQELIAFPKWFNIFVNRLWVQLRSHAPVTLPRAKIYISRWLCIPTPDRSIYRDEAKHCINSRIGDLQAFPSTQIFYIAFYVKVRNRNRTTVPSIRTQIILVSIWTAQYAVWYAAPEVLA